LQNRLKEIETIYRNGFDKAGKGEVNEMDMSPATLSYTTPTRSPKATPKQKPQPVSLVGNKSTLFYSDESTLDKDVSELSKSSLCT
jgi:hypothetical protein